MNQLAKIFPFIVWFRLTTLETIKADFFAGLTGAIIVLPQSGIMGVVQQFGGSVSAEHGVGLLKKRYLQYTRSSAEIDQIKVLKQALDPLGVLNPGKILDL